MILHAAGVDRGNRGSIAVPDKKPAAQADRRIAVTCMVEKNADIEVRFAITTGDGAPECLNRLFVTARSNNSASRISPISRN